MLPWITSEVCIVLRVVFGEIWVSLISSFLGLVEIPTVEFGEGDISTETETRRKRRSRSARISRRLLPLGRSPSASMDFSGRDHSRTLLEQAFDNRMYRLQ